MQILNVVLKFISIVKFPMARSTFQSGSLAFSKKTFENAIVALNSLQTNSTALSISIKMKRQQIHDEANMNLRETEKFLERIDGFDMNILDTLSVIHVSGSKGKGSVCTFTEAILRENNVKTGLFTSPHLESCTERIKLQGYPINKSAFNAYFWEVYDALNRKKSHEQDLPSYFKFLQIMAFYIFVKEKVDVAIVEVGIGGEFDSTNILRNTEVVGITSLHLEHTQLLGDTIEEIAWQKSGIIKSGSSVFYMHHSKDSVNQVIKARFKELKGQRLSAIPSFESYTWSNNLVPDFTQSSDINKINFSMAAQLSARWMSNRKLLSESHFKNDLLWLVDESFVTAMQKCNFEGRFQEIRSGNVKFYFDGAHTKESMDITADWFSRRISNNIKGINILMFNLTGERDSKQILESLSGIPFDILCFTTNVEYKNQQNEHTENFTAIHQSVQFERCIRHQEVWREITTEKQLKLSRIECFSSIQQALNFIYDVKDNNTGNINVLITGSLHLIGGTLKVIKALDFESLKEKLNNHRVS